MTSELESRIKELEKGRRDTDAENIKRDIEIYELKAEVAKLRSDIDELKKNRNLRKITNSRPDASR
jgi:septal ring factor EnvC (AmiA/AmiB activator)